MKLRPLAVAGVVVLALALPVAPALTAHGPDAEPAAVEVAAEAALGSMSTGSGGLSGATRTTTLLGEPTARELQTTEERTAVEVRVVRPRGQTLTLQRREGGAWRTASSARAPRSAAATVELDVPVATGSHDYRVVMARSPYNLRSVTERFSIFQSDAEEHRDYVARARTFVADLCPSTPIYVDSPAVTDGDTVGMAWTSWRWTSGGGRTEWTWSQTIELRSGLTDVLLEHTVLHECAHVVQVRPLREGQDVYDTSVAATEAVFADGDAAPHEQQADCMASAVTGETAYNYYASSCAGERAESAEALWERYGRRYQDPELTWTVTDR